MRIIFIFLLLSSCGYEAKQNILPPNKESLANIITARVAKNIKAESKLYPCGSGGRVREHVERLALAFNYYEPLDIDSGRELLIYAAEKYKAALNSDEEIRPFLKNYPFENKNVEVVIYIQKPDGHDFGYNKLCVIAARDGELVYFVHKDPNSLLSITHSESYEEAFEKVKSTQM